MAPDSPSFFANVLQEFRDLEAHSALFATLSAVDAESVSEEVQMEELNLQCDTKYTDVGGPDLYKFPSREKYMKLVSAAAKITAMFGNTYVVHL